MKIKDNLYWIGHASFYLKTEYGNIFIDPYNVQIKEKADLILITHSHFDHFSMQDIKKISNSKTKIFATNDCVEKSDILIDKILPGLSVEFNNIKIHAIPAYNTNKDRLSFHPKRNGWVGYIIEIDNEKLYHAGDTDLIEEMKTINDIDIALLPAGGKYTMDAYEAIEAAKIINAKYTVPMHYKHILGEEKSNKLENEFVKNLDTALIMHEIQPPDFSPF
ncbi:MAG: MBL fold metallo-hydrolase [Candidatus Micrarchaeaceae archaeon]